MKKTLAALATGAVAFMAIGTAAHADYEPQTFEVDPGGTFTVTVPCDAYAWEIQTVEFEFQGQEAVGYCIGEPEPEGTVPEGSIPEGTGVPQVDEPAGFRMPGRYVQDPTPGTGPVTATFTAPLAPGEYIGSYVVSWDYYGVSTDGPQGFRAAPAVLVQGPPSPEEGEFTVIVNQVATTTTPTTAAPTTLAPTTTAAATSPQAPTTAPTTTAAAVSPVLPETGSNDSGNMAVIAITLLALGGGLIVATRYRRSSSAS